MTHLYAHYLLLTQVYFVIFKRWYKFLFLNLQFCFCVLFTNRSDDSDPVPFSNSFFSECDQITKTKKNILQKQKTCYTEQNVIWLQNIPIMSFQHICIQVKGMFCKGMREHQNKNLHYILIFMSLQFLIIFWFSVFFTLVHLLLFNFWIENVFIFVVGRKRWVMGLVVLISIKLNLT